uniref:Uncharacterized protein n=1 Tax=Quercus lobata TaxID=97700 RepID=A0A7N2R528_QUELO
MLALGFGRPIWLVQLSLLEVPVIVWLYRLCADRCLLGEIGACEVCPSGGLLFFSLVLNHQGLMLASLLEKLGFLIH